MLSLRRGLLVGIALGLSFLSFPSAQALHVGDDTSLEPSDDGDFNIIDFCNAPYEAVCGDEAEYVPAREAGELADAKKKITRHALRKVADNVLHLSNPEKFTSKDLEALQEKDEKKYRIVYNAYLDDVLDQVKKQAQGAEIFSNEQFAKILARFQPAIEALSVGEGTKGAMRGAMSHVKLISAADFIEKKLAKDDLDSFTETCGEDGMEDNAFASPDESGKNSYFVVCPGALLAATGLQDSPAPKNDRFGAENIWLIAHELGHHVDATTADNKFAEVYAKQESCFKNYHSTEVASPDMHDYMSESSADYWATQVLADYLQQFDNPDTRQGILARNLEFLCNTQDDRVHPDGRFRIVNSVRRDPRISELLGCQRPESFSASDSSCGPSGTLKPVFYSTHGKSWPVMVAE